MLRVVYVLPYDWGGMTHYTAELANAVAQNAEVTVIGSKGIHEEYFNEKVKIVKVFETFNFTPTKLKKLFSFRNITAFRSFKNIKTIEKINPDIIHLTTPLIPPVPLYIKLYGLDKKYPMVYTKHCIKPNSSFMINLIENFVALFEPWINFKKIIVHTQKGKDILNKDKGIPDEKLSVIPHGAYTFFKKYHRQVPRERNTLLFFGNIREYKGLKYLIQAIPLITEEIPDIKVIIAGQGSLSDLDLIDKKYRSNMEIHNGYIPDEKVPELFQRAEIVVLPYTTMSGQSGVVNIALAYKKPIVSTTVSCFTEVIEDGVNGCLVPPKDPGSLAKAIIEVLKDEEMKEKMGENSYKKSENLSWDNIANKHIDVYKTLLN